MVKTSFVLSLLHLFIHRAACPVCSSELFSSSASTVSCSRLIWNILGPAAAESCQLQFQQSQTTSPHRSSDAKSCSFSNSVRTSSCDAKLTSHSIWETPSKLALSCYPCKGKEWPVSSTNLLSSNPWQQGQHCSTLGLQPSLAWLISQETTSTFCHLVQPGPYHTHMWYQSGHGVSTTIASLSDLAVMVILVVVIMLIIDQGYKLTV